MLPCGPFPEARAKFSYSDARECSVVAWLPCRCLVRSYVDTGGAAEREYGVETPIGWGARLEIVKKSFAGIPLVEIGGDLDHLSADDFDHATRDSLSDGDRLLIDLALCRYMDSGGLAVLLSTARDLPPGGWLGILRSGKNILRLFEIVGLTSQPGVRLFDDYSALPETLDVQADQR
jgi:anti-anti-sigma factor